MSKIFRRTHSKAASCSKARGRGARDRRSSDPEIVSEAVREFRGIFKRQTTTMQLP